MKNHLLKTILILIIFISFILIFQNSVQATSLKLQIPLPGNMDQVIQIDPNSLGLYISNLYKFAVGALAIISVVMIMIGGFQWLMSAGRSEHVTSAKDKIYNSIIGLILALTSYLLLNTINPNLVNFQSLNIINISVYDIEVPELEGEGCCSDVQNQSCLAKTKNNCTTTFQKVGPDDWDLKGGMWVEYGFCDSSNKCQSPATTTPST